MVITGPKLIKLCIQARVAYKGLIEVGSLIQECVVFIDNPNTDDLQHNDVDYKTSSSHNSYSYALLKYTLFLMVKPCAYKELYSLKVISVSKLYILKRFTFGILH